MSLSETYHLVFQDVVGEPISTRNIMMYSGEPNLKTVQVSLATISSVPQDAVVVAYSTDDAGYSLQEIVRLPDNTYYHMSTSPDSYDTYSADTPITVILEPVEHDEETSSLLLQDILTSADDARYSPFWYFGKVLPESSESDLIEKIVRGEFEELKQTLS